MNFATFFAAILIFSLVAGLIPSRAGRSLTLNVPKPTRAILSPATSASLTAATVASRAFFASALDNTYEKGDDVNTILIKSVLNGTPLPKGHGRLIDADAKQRELADEYHGMISDESMNIYKIIQMLDEVPTIIEADTESEDKE